MVQLLMSSVEIKFSTIRAKVASVEAAVKKTCGQSRIVFGPGFSYELSNLRLNPQMLADVQRWDPDAPK